MIEISNHRCHNYTPQPIVPSSPPSADFAESPFLLWTNTHQSDQASAEKEHSGGFGNRIIQSDDAVTITWAMGVMPVIIPGASERMRIDM